MNLGIRCGKAGFFGELVSNLLASSRFVGLFDIQHFDSPEPFVGVQYRTCDLKKSKKPGSRDQSSVRVHWGRVWSFYRNSTQPDRTETQHGRSRPATLLDIDAGS